VSIGRIQSLYKVSLLEMDNVESRARKGKKLEKRTGSSTCCLLYMEHSTNGRVSHFKANILTRKIWPIRLAL